MRRYIFLWVIWAVCLTAADLERKRAYVQALRSQPPLTYATLYKRFFKPFPLDAKHPDIEEEFGIYNGDFNATAIDFSALCEKNVVALTPRYGVVFVNVDHFDTYGILTDAEGKVLFVLLLGYRKGMREWQIERDTVLRPEKGSLFGVTDERRDAEWIEPQIKGDMIVNERRLYRISVDEKALRFRIHPTSDKALYQEQDKRLNRLYGQAMKLLDKSEKRALKRVQRAWLTYVTLACDTFLTDATEQPKHSVHVQAYRFSCLYEKTKRRADELERLVSYRKFYR